MPTPERSHTFAAVDLGSNSFHLLVARRSHGELRVLDRLKEMVRLAEGLHRDGALDAPVQERALDCLARFGQRLRGIPVPNIRAVGTQTVRRMKQANSFLMVAETALGCPVDVISGREEARLIYLGVSQGVAGHEERRLVVDIGGGSTELVIGEGLTPLEMESLQFGCVSLTRWYFRNGKLTPRRWQKARQAVLAELQELQTRYRTIGWHTAIGSSGTARAVFAICQARGWCEHHITAEAISQLQRELLSFGSIEAIELPGLSERRRAVIVGGVVMLAACFEALGVEAMVVSPYALREGLLHDLLGRLEHRDPRDKTVQAFRLRYAVDAEQVARVKRVALSAFDQLADPLSLGSDDRELLSWAADLHEAGLSISHSNYQVHSGYLVEHSDLAGFSQQEQLMLAALVRCHRRPIPRGHAASLPERLHRRLAGLLFCLRFAWVLARTRDDNAVPSFRLAQRDDGVIHVHFDRGWMDGHPLTLADLGEEQLHIGVLGLQLELLGNDCHGA